VLAVTLGVIVAVLFAAVATSDTVRYADGPPDFFEQLDDVEPRTDVEVEVADVEQVEERRELEPAPWIDTVARFLLWTVLAIAATLAIAKLWRDRPSFGWRRRGPRPEPFDVLPDAATTITDDAERQRAVLGTGRPRDAIVACWLRVETAVVAAGVERRPSDTSTELVERVLGEYRLDADAIGSLAGLYREARFSDHEMSEDARASAISALDEVHAGLRRSARVAT